MQKLSAGKFHWITPSSPRVSFDLGTRKSHDLAPLLGFVSDEPCEIGWRARRQNGPQLGKPSGDFGISQRCVDVLVQLDDNLGGCVLRRTRPKPGAGVEARQDVGHRGYV